MANHDQNLTAHPMSGKALAAGESPNNVAKHFVFEGLELPVGGKK